MDKDTCSYYYTHYYLYHIYRFVEDFWNVVTTLVLMFVIVDNVHFVRNQEKEHVPVVKQVREVLSLVNIFVFSILG